MDANIPRKYMQNLCDDEWRQTDTALAPIRALEKIQESVEGGPDKDWELPCHSIVLSVHSPVFAASRRCVNSTCIEKNNRGKRMLRLPINKAAAERLLQFCYGTLPDLEQLTLRETTQLAVLSHMQDMPGKPSIYAALDCKEALRNIPSFFDITVLDILTKMQVPLIVCVLELVTRYTDPSKILSK